MARKDGREDPDHPRAQPWLLRSRWATTAAAKPGKGGGILKASGGCWVGKKRTCPEVAYVHQSWDTAFETKRKLSYSARTTWGVFKKDGPATAWIVLGRLGGTRSAIQSYASWRRKPTTDWATRCSFDRKRQSEASLSLDLRMAGCQYWHILLT